MNIPNWWVYFKKKTDEDHDFRIVKPAKGDVIIEKTEMSAFAGSNIDQQLQENNMKALLISGIYRSACVHETVLDACSKGYKVFIMSDCVEDSFKTDNDYNFEVMRKKGASIVKSEDVLRVLNQPNAPTTPLMPV